MMIFEVQDETGLVENANAYCDVECFRQYFRNINVDTNSFTDDEIKGAIVQGTTYIDINYDFIGYKMADSEQTTEFPRFLRRKPNPAEAPIPREVEKANCELGMFVLSGGELFRSFEADERGVQFLDQKVAQIQERVRYATTNTDESTTALLSIVDKYLEKSGWIRIRKSVVERM